MILYIYIPQHPCMVYLPTYTLPLKIQPSVGKYTIHGCYGYLSIYIYISLSFGGRNFSSILPWGEVFTPKK